MTAPAIEERRRHHGKQLTMGKRRRDEGSSEKRCDCGNRRRKHLYVVLDDWDKGFTVHKLDALSFLDDSDDDGGGGGELKRLPDPPAVRITEAQHSPMLFAGLGTTIFVANKKQLSPQATGALVYDTETAAMAMGPCLPENPCCVFVAAGRGESKGKHNEENEKLYTLAKVDHGGRSNHPRGYLMGVSVHALSWARSPASEPWLPSHEWAWESAASPMAAPFDGNEETVVSYAVHPDGRTIFFSTRGTGYRPAGTYSFDTEQREWRSHGEWVLPFDGQGYYERELDAWVGLHKDGYICCCEATPGAGAGAAPEWRKTERKLFREGDRERHLGATLTYMGNNVFCLVESVVREGVEPGRAYGAGRGCALHVTVLGLKYSRDGELQATVGRVTKSYAVCKYIPGFAHEAFWM